ncbi:MAG: YbaB/EbfC family nucleoid-associated protein [Deltaproteobacteria bacterium]|nr:YbaB/EbfC family nucleoid-associated protein [Deltaproteobacteria bacterium]MBW2362533.1 YbaB/EbfC family nucleoid-associated protein [Deltaproteobacteria bacterium]
MNPEELGRLMEQAQEVQAKLAALQQELALRRFEGSSGGGMVTAVVTGALRVHEVRIEPSLVERGDLEMLQDLTAAALNAALGYAQSTVQAELQRASAGLQLPVPPNAD